MSDTAILVENLSKRYRIGLKDEVADTLAGSVVSLIKRPLRNLKNLRRLSAFNASSRDARDVIWALRNVSFEVKQGEVVGIVGPNGAGKSTLLKVLSRITEPTAGRATVHGRVASLLEVGTGFHPELTGRENIFLNGTVLGMTRKEVHRKFDEIVAFSGVERFIDTPVKRYSSGMQVRLAFSVAAHLDPEILLVDEVLAVGDAEFQRKCLGKMRDVTAQGRTVFLVSHNMAAIRSLCRRTMLIQKGALTGDGPTGEVLRKYLDQEAVSGAVISGEALEARITRRGWDSPPDRPAVRCLDVRLLGRDGAPRTEFQSDEEITISVSYQCIESHNDFRVILSVVDDDSRPVVTTQTADDPSGAGFSRPAKGMYRSVCVLPANFFGERRFYLSLRLVFPHIDELRFDKLLSFDVRFAGYNGVHYMNHAESLLRPRLAWTTEQLRDSQATHA